MKIGYVPHPSAQEKKDLKMFLEVSTEAGVISFSIIRLICRCSRDERPVREGHDIVDSFAEQPVLGFGVAFVGIVETLL